MVSIGLRLEAQLVRPHKGAEDARAAHEPPRLVHLTEARAYAPVNPPLPIASSPIAAASSRPTCAAASAVSVFTAAAAAAAPALTEGDAGRAAVLDALVAVLLLPPVSLLPLLFPSVPRHGV